MDWVSLGHAMWLARAGGLRILFDPLLEDPHMGGVLEVCPGRDVCVEALRPDFVFVSHAHPDHFDPASLRRLAQVDSQSVLVTPDPFVADVAKHLGFSSTRCVPAGTRIELHGGVHVVTTPSLAEEPEWGVMVGTEHGAVWHQVDTVLRDVAHVRDVVAASLGGLGRGASEVLTLALVRAQPLREVAAQIGDATGFPFAEYAALLQQIRGIEAKALVPTSAGARHAAAFSAMNDLVYPVGAGRAVADLRALLPNREVFAPITGGMWQIREEEVRFEPDGGADFVRVREDATPTFRPVGLPALVDPDLEGGPLAPRRDAVRRWVHDALALALAGDTGRATRPMRFVLEVVWPSATDVFTLSERGEGDAWSVEELFEPEYDVLNQIAGSMLYGVIAGRRHWGEPLLGGLLRAADRAYDVDGSGLRRLEVPTIFLYRALSYEQSMRQWVESLL